MCNEMGNQNVSGIQEEENAATEAPEKSQEIAHSDVEKEGNEIVHGKIAGGLSSDDPSQTGDPDVEKQNLSAREKDETELKPRSEPLEVPVEPNVAASQEHQNEATSSNDGGDLEKPRESNLEQNDILGSNDDHQIQKETLVEKESQELSVNPNLVVIHEFAELEDETMVENHNGSPEGREEIFKPSPSHEVDEKGPSLETEDTNTVLGGVVSDTIPEVEKKSDEVLLVEKEATEEEKVIDTSKFEEKCENESEYEVGNGLNNVGTEKSTVQNGFEKNCNQELPTEMTLSPSDSFQEVTEPHEKCMVLSGPAMEENPFSEQLLNELKTEKVSDSQSDSMSDSQSDSMLVESDHENGKESVADFPSQDGMEKEIQPKEGNEMAPEIGTVPTELTVKEYNLGEENTKKRTFVREENSEDSNEMGNDKEIETTAMKQETANAERFEFSNGGSVQSSMGRFSTESNPENVNALVELRKSPSFDFDLSLDARSEESDQTPLLHHDKTSIRSFSSQNDINFRNSIPRTEYSEEQVQYESVPVEEKTIRMERSDSEKSRTPFLSLLKENEKNDSHIGDKKESKESCDAPTKEIVLSSPKGGAKRKPRSFIFSNCICCAAAIP